MQLELVPVHPAKRWVVRFLSKNIAVITHTDEHRAALSEEVENDKGKLVWKPKKDAAAIAEELVSQQKKPS